jgi:hypothetical protein
MMDENSELFESITPDEVYDSGEWEAWQDGIERRISRVEKSSKYGIVIGGAALFLGIFAMKTVMGLVKALTVPPDSLPPLTSAFPEATVPNASPFADAGVGSERETLVSDRPQPTPWLPSEVVDLPEDLGL